MNKEVIFKHSSLSETCLDCAILHPFLVRESAYISNVVMNTLYQCWNSAQWDDCVRSHTLTVQSLVINWWVKSDVFEQRNPKTVMDLWWTQIIHPCIIQMWPRYKQRNLIPEVIINLSTDNARKTSHRSNHYIHQSQNTYFTLAMIWYAQH